MEGYLSSQRVSLDPGVTGPESLTLLGDGYVQSDRTGDEEGHLPDPTCHRRFP